MRYCKTKHDITLQVLIILIVFTIFGIQLGQDRYAYSESLKASSTANAAADPGVGLVNIHTSPLHLKAGSKFEILSTVVNNSPNMIVFIAGCDSPLSANFARNVMIRHTQGCTTVSPSFNLNPAE